MGFSRQEYWSGLPLPSPGDLPHPGMVPTSPTLQVNSLPLEPWGKPKEVVVIVQSLSRVQLFATPWTAALQASLSITNSQSLLKLMSIESVIPSNRVISSCFQSFPASGSLPISRLFASGGQSTGTSASASVLTVNIQGWFPLGLTGLISLLSKGLSSVFSSTTIRKCQFFSSLPSLWSSFHICTWLLKKPYLWLYRICGQSDVSAF